jgi:hypothetical protein
MHCWPIGVLITVWVLMKRVKIKLLQHSGQMKLHRINGYRDIGGTEKAAA